MRQKKKGRLRRREAEEHVTFTDYFRFCSAIFE